ncbi:MULTISPECIES: TerD family protein [unclassified Streptomyces]|uniref:TerD family protein n=1 Tax=unclassified Streptomyces TaxID=2593676 RepID=UPI0006ADABFD|nr:MULTISPECIES: TerD family protein [unclassified Streptomyces]KOX27869.1 resistance protein [Streptomyces sp. NRRL F-6491]KOX38244.1 resistance protein [Streptomyces sp. NRRL F-6492]
MNRIPEGDDVPVPPQALHVAAGWQTGHGVPEVDVSALLLDAAGRVRGDADLVFYNHADHPSGSVRHLGRSAPGAPGDRAADWLWLDLARVEPDVARIVVAASADGGGFGRVPGLDVRVTDAAGAPVAYRPIGGATTETAFVFGAFHRWDGGWRFRTAVRGYASGLAGLATDFGIVVEPPPPPIPGPGYVPPAAPPPYAPPAPAPAPALPVRVPAPVPSGAEFRPAVYRGRGKETVHCDPRLPAGGWVLLEVESYHSLLTTVGSCDAYGRSEDFLLTAYEDDVRARTVALVPRSRPLTLRVDADAPWTLRVLPLSHARRFDSHVEGTAHDLVVYDGPPGVLDFTHHGEGRFAVHRHAAPEDPLHDDEERTRLVDEVGEVRVGAPVAGPGLLRISGDGPWKCVVRR